MPTYNYKCNECDKIEEKFNRIAEYETNAPVCHGSPMSITILTAPQGFVQRDCYYKCPVTNEGVTTWRQRRNLMAEHRLVDANDLGSTHAKRKEKADKVKQQMADAQAAVPKELRQAMKKNFERKSEKFESSLN